MGSLAYIEETSFWDFAGESLTVRSDVAADVMARLSTIRSLVWARRDVPHCATRIGDHTGVRRIACRALIFPSRISLSGRADTVPRLSRRRWRRRSGWR